MIKKNINSIGVLMRCDSFVNDPYPHMREILHNIREYIRSLSASGKGVKVDRDDAEYQTSWKLI